MMSKIPTIIFSAAYHAIRQHIVRSLLTIIGIIIGIAAIICTFSIGRGAQERIQKQIAALGKNAIYITSGSFGSQGATSATQKQIVPLSLQDYHALKEQFADEIVGITPYIQGKAHIEYHGKNALNEINGVNESALTLSGYTLQNQSKFFSSSDIALRANVVVIGSKMAESLFGKQNPLNATVRIDKIPFMVIGVLQPITQFFGGDDPNYTVYIPYTTAQRIFPAAAQTPDKVDIIHIGSRDEKNTQTLIRKIKRFLHMRHRLYPDAPHDFTVFDQNTISSVIDETACTINFFILIAASISLLVAGIGVMNIMLVSVRERTQEIGIRLALGATPFLIQLQFLVESIILCVAGGILGIVVGIVPPLLLRYYELFPAKIELAPTLSALIVTVCIGLFFGFYPARLASKLDPIQALQER